MERSPNASRAKLVRESGARMKENTVRRCREPAYYRISNGRFERGAPSGGAPAGPTVPPQHRWVPPPKSGARTIPPSLAGSSPRARRGTLLTRGRGFDGEEGPQAFTQSGRPFSGRNVHRARRGVPPAPPTIQPRSRRV
ncbi:hypothetical protein NDU88_002246 [Pleurodeles waltl]|uniref:Uncharacterized protein n=1 Tax=Pleurodeles waltl TaxID=8319 RepID=A0AAV7T1V5_PLEWA|nr:hypothetical protein NDU88_002246 [Pleurodeles waltl]